MLTNERVDELINECATFGRDVPKDGSIQWMKRAEIYKLCAAVATEAQAATLATVTHGVGATIEWQVRGRHHYEWHRASEEIARAMYLVNPGHVRAVTVVEGAVPKAG